MEILFIFGLVTAGALLGAVITYAAQTGSDAEAPEESEVVSELKEVHRNLDQLALKQQEDVAFLAGAIKSLRDRLDVGFAKNDAKLNFLTERLDNLVKAIKKLNGDFTEVFGHVLVSINAISATLIDLKARAEVFAKKRDQDPDGTAGAATTSNGLPKSSSVERDGLEAVSKKELLEVVDQSSNTQLIAVGNQATLDSSEFEEELLDAVVTSTDLTVGLPVKAALVFVTLYSAHGNSLFKTDVWVYAIGRILLVRALLCVVFFFCS